MKTNRIIGYQYIDNAFGTEKKAITLSTPIPANAKEVYIELPEGFTVEVASPSLDGKRRYVAKDGLVYEFHFFNGNPYLAYMPNNIKIPVVVKER